MKQWYCLAGAILSEVAASLSLKAAIDIPALYAVVAVGYTCAFALLALALRQGMALGVAYGIWGALGVTLTALLSAVVFDEPLTAVMGVGIALVVAGVLTVEMGAERATAAAGVRMQPEAEAASKGSTQRGSTSPDGHRSVQSGPAEPSATVAEHMSDDSERSPEDSAHGLKGVGRGSDDSARSLDSADSAHDSMERGGADRSVPRGKEVHS